MRVALKICRARLFRDCRRAARGLNPPVTKRITMGFRVVLALTLWLAMEPRSNYGKEREFYYLGVKLLR